MGASSSSSSSPSLPEASTGYTGDFDSVITHKNNNDMKTPFLCDASPCPSLSASMHDQTSSKTIKYISIPAWLIYSESDKCHILKPSIRKALEHFECIGKIQIFYDKKDYTFHLHITCCDSRTNEEVRQQNNNFICVDDILYTNIRKIIEMSTGITINQQQLYVILFSDQDNNNDNFKRVDKHKNIRVQSYV